jgi:hypothetical protein
MHEIKVPRESANDFAVLVADVNYSNGDWVSENSVVASIEGEKAVYDILSEISGHIYYVAKAQDRVEIDGVIAILFSEPIHNFEEIQHKYFLPRQTPAEVSEKPAAYFQKKSLIRKPNSDIQRVAVIGAGRGLDQILDAAILSESMKIVLAYDDVKFEKIFGYSGIPVIGAVNYDRIMKDYADGLFDALLISVSTNIKFRKTCFDMLSPHIPFANLIHRTASVSPNSLIGSGNIILANSVVGSDARIGNNNFISAMCNIEHHCRVGNNCTFGPGVVFSGGVVVCDEVKFGTGIFVEPFHIFEERQFVKSGSILTA